MTDTAKEMAIAIWMDESGWHAESARMPELCLSAPTLIQLLGNLRDGVDMMVGATINEAIEDATSPVK